MGRWTDLAEWRGPTVNEGDGDGRPNEPEDRAVECRGCILHIADGYYEGTIAWQKNPDADVSSQFVVAGPRDSRFSVADGRAAQVVDTDIRAWTQRDGNGHWLSIECSGFSGDALSPAQIETCARILAKGHRVYGYPLQLATSPSGRGLGHHSMGAESGANWGHSECPGPRIKAQKPAILARAIQIANGTNPPPEDDVALTEAQAKALELVPAMAWRTEALLQNLAEVRGGPTKGERNELHYALAALGLVLTAEQLATVAASAETGAGQGVASVLANARATTTITTTGA
jgi:hypothetical protein